LYKIHLISDPKISVSIWVQPVDHLTEKWTSFHKNDKEAQKELEQKLIKFSETHLIVTAKKTLIESKRTRGRLENKKDGQELFIYSFMVVKAPKKINSI